MTSKAIVVHSGGMDSSICLALAIKEHGAKNILSLSFTYGQRHNNEIKQAQKICKKWGVENKIINIDCLKKITSSALLDKSIKINKEKTPNTLVVGRNGLIARVAAIHAESLAIETIYMGIIEVEEANSGYRDCSRKYMDIVQAALQLDFDNPKFTIKTPLVYMTKPETMELAHELGVLEYLCEESITCYEGIPKIGCKICPACKLRNKGLKDFLFTHDEVNISYKNQILNLKN